MSNIPDVTELPEDAPECFVIMPVGPIADYTADHWQGVYQHLFRPACQAAGYRPNLVSENRHAGLIHLDILKGVVHAPFAICDVSGRNPNVLYELGLRQAFDMKTLILKDDSDDRFIFDISGIRHTKYAREQSYPNVVEGRKRIRDAILETRNMPEGESTSLITLLSLKAAHLKSVDQNDVANLLLAKLDAIEEKISTNLAPVNKGHSYAELMKSGSWYTHNKTSLNTYSLHDSLRQYELKQNGFSTEEKREVLQELEQDFLYLMRRAGTVPLPQKELKILQDTGAQIKQLLDRLNNQAQSTS